jgi:signal transduction histidine kinase
LSIRKQLLWLSVGSTVPLMLAGALTLHSLWRAGSSELEKSLAQRAQLAGVALERWIEAQRQPLNTIAVYKDAGLALPADYFRFMVSTRPHWLDLRLFDEGWREAATWPDGAGALPAALADKLFAEVRRSGSWEIVTDWEARDAGGPVMLIAVPVERGGAVVVRARADALKGVFREVELPAGAVLSVSDHQGRVLYHSDEASALVGTDITASPLYGALGERPVTLLETEGALDGVRRTYGLARAGDTGCVVKIGIPHTTLYRPAREQFTRYLFYSVVALACALFAALLIARRISQPIRQLRGLTHQLGTGGSSVRTDGRGRGEIAELGEAFNLMAARIEEREENLRVLNRRLSELNELKSEVVSGVSHELRTPLTTIKMLSRLMLHNELSEAERRESLEVIAMECDRQIDLVLNLLDLSRIEAGVFSHTFARVDMLELLNVCARVERHAAKLRGHDFAVRLPPQLPPARTDRKALRRVLCAIIENAIKYTPDGGRVTLAARAEGEEVVIDVSDTGPGIRTEDYPYVFDKFWRGPRLAAATATAAGSSPVPAADFVPEVPGVGLGLYLARTILQQLDGRISFVSEVGRGSTFTVRLPVWHAESIVTTVEGAR